MKILFDESHARETWWKEATNFQHQLCANEIPLHFDPLKGRAIFNNDKADQLSQSKQKQNIGQTVAECRLTKLSTTSSGILWK